MDKIFPYNIYKFKVSNYKKLNKKLVSEIYKLKDNDINGIERSNRSGWHSETLEPKFKELSEIISNFFSKEILKVDKNLKITTIWASINSKNCFNEEHDHHGAYYSGVYYVKVPKNSGNLYFINPYYWNTKPIRKYPNICRYENENKEIEYKSKEGELYFFVGEMPHKVGKNLSNDDRISISFNFNFYHLREQFEERKIKWIS